MLKPLSCKTQSLLGRRRTLDSAQGQTEKKSGPSDSRSPALLALIEQKASRPVREPELDAPVKPNAPDKGLELGCNGTLALETIGGAAIIDAVVASLNAPPSAAAFAAAVHLIGDAASSGSATEEQAKGNSALMGLSGVAAGAIPSIARQSEVDPAVLRAVAGVAIGAAAGGVGCEPLLPGSNNQGSLGFIMVR